MRLIPLDGFKPDFHVIQINKDVWIVLSNDSGALAATLMASPGSISIGQSKKRWKAFLKDPSVQIPDDWSVAAMAKVFRKWFKKNYGTYED